MRSGGGERLAWHSEAKNIHGKSASKQVKIKHGGIRPRLLLDILDVEEIMSRLTW